MGYEIQNPELFDVDTAKILINSINNEIDKGSVKDAMDYLKIFIALHPEEKDIWKQLSLRVMDILIHRNQEEIDLLLFKDLDHFFPDDIELGKKFSELGYDHIILKIGERSFKLYLCLIDQVRIEVGNKFDLLVTDPEDVLVDKNIVIENDFHHKIAASHEIHDIPAANILKYHVKIIVQTGVECNYLFFRKELSRG